MAPSDQADSTLEIRLTADTADATGGVAAAARDIAGAMQGVARAAEEAGKAAGDAMNKTAREAKRAAEEVKGVGDRAQMTAGQLRMVATRMAGLALDALDTGPDQFGRRSAAADFGQAGMNALQVGLMTKSPALALVDGALEMITVSFKRQAQEEAANRKREELSFSMLEQVTAYEKLRDRTERFTRTLDALSDGEGSAADRRARLSAEIRRREAEDQRLGSVQRRAAGEADESLFRSASQARALNARELAALRSLRIEDAPKEPARRERAAFDPAEGDTFLKKGMNLFGGLSGGVSDAATRLAQEGNGIARQQLFVLNRIADRQTAAAWS